MLEQGLVNWKNEDSRIKRAWFRLEFILFIICVAIVSLGLFFFKCKLEGGGLSEERVCVESSMIMNSQSYHFPCFTFSPRKAM